MSLDEKAINAAAEVMARRRPTVVLTGAGVSVESGIPDFRSSGGLWEKFDPMEYATIDAFLADPVKVWGMLHELEGTLTAAEPNPGHRALGRLEEAEVVSAVITQNIDNLHQEGGSREVIEFHGNGRRFYCLTCDQTVDEEETREELQPDRIPRCPDCSAILKPDVVLFGEAIAEAELDRSFDHTQRCSVMLVAGTSATVMPAATLPLLAKRMGAAIIEVNLERTELTPIADHVLVGPSGMVLPTLAEAVLARLAS